MGHMNRRVTQSRHSGVLGIEGDDIGGESLWIRVAKFTICSLTVKNKISPDGQIFLKSLVSSQRVVPPVDEFGDPGPREGSEPGLRPWSPLWPVRAGRL